MWQSDTLDIIIMKLEISSFELALFSLIAT